MDLEGTTNDAPELATPAPQAEPVTQNDDEGPIDLDAPVVAEEGEPAPVAETEEQGEETPGPETPEVELIDYDVDGKAYKVPKELEGHLMRQADYTRKTQEVAEIRRQAEATMEEAKQTFATSQEVIGARAQLINVDQQLQQYENVNWQQLEAEDPFGAQSHWRQFQQLREARGQITGFLDQKQGELSAKGEQETATRLQETARYAQEKIPGWSPEMDAKIIEFATSTLGFTPDTLKQACNPQVYQTLAYAWLGYQASQKQQAAPKPAAPAPKPLSKVSATGQVPSQKDPEDMTMTEYAEYRRQQSRK